MDRVILVEVRDRRLHLRSRHRLERFPISIGRAYDNDIIVDDRYVDAHHASLSLDDDGVVVIEDLESVNGVKDGLRGARAARIRLPSGGTVRLGETVLRMLDVGHNVARAVPLADEGRLVSALLTPTAAWCVVGGSVLLAMLLAWLRQYSGERAVVLISAALFLFLGLCIWAGIWAIVGRSQGGRGRFLTHLAIASLALSAATLWVAAMDYMEFLWPELALRPAIQYGGSVLIVAAALSAHLGLVSMLSRPRRMAIAGLATIVLLGLAEVGSWADENEFDNALHYSDVVRPMGAGLAHTVTLDRFLDDAGGLRADLDSLAERRNRATAANRPAPHSETAR